MNKKIFIFFCALLLGLGGIAFVLISEKTLVTHPKGSIAESILTLIITNTILMLIIIVPTLILLFAVVWRYCIKNENAKYDPGHSYGVLGELLTWGLPSIIVAIMATVTWNSTHQLNPYKPIENDVKPLTIQVIALDWKWLFIYPEQGIATLNYFHIPEKTPIHLQLSADGSPMNSFWIPQLGGQIYSMTGMTTTLYLIANEVGDYTGRAVEINGEGYADMTFPAKASSLKDFEEWVAEANRSPLHLTEESYQELVKPAINKNKLLYSEVEKDLYHKIVHHYMYPTNKVL